VTDADLEALVAREPERWRTATEVTLTHVFLLGEPERGSD